MGFKDWLFGKNKTDIKKTEFENKNRIKNKTEPSVRIDKDYMYKLIEEKQIERLIYFAEKGYQERSPFGTYWEDAIWGLIKLGYAKDENISQVIAKIRDKHPGWRLSSANVLFRMYKGNCCPESIKPMDIIIKMATNDPDPDVRKELVECLNDLPSIDSGYAALPILCSVVRNDQDEHVRWAALEAMSSYKYYHRDYLPSKEFFAILDYALRDITLAEKAAEMLMSCGSEAIPVLTEALKDDRFEVYNWAAWALSMGFREEKYHADLVPAIQYFSETIDNAVIIKNRADSYDPRVRRAVMSLSEIGDLSALPSLENLLNKVQNKIKEVGVIREYVNDGVMGGYYSTNDGLGSIKSAISRIKERHGS